MFPSELKRFNNFVNHRDKVPVNPLTLGPASSVDPSTWTDYVTATKTGLPLGFVLQPPFLGVDLDHCLEGGRLNDFARNVVNKCQSYTEISPSGTGLHIYLKGELKNAIKTKGFEAYQKGRFFTVTEKGYAHFGNLPIRTISEGLLLSCVPEISRIRRPLPELLDDLQDGNRNNNLFAIASGLRARGCSPELIYKALEPKAKEVNLPLDEFEALVRRASQYEPNPQSNQEHLDINSFLNDVQTVEWVVPGLIAKSSIGFIAGLPESRKTWLTIDLAVEIARGGIWLGKFPVKQGKVLFVDQERHKSETQRRFKGVLLAKSLMNSSITKNSLFIKSGTTHRLNLQPSFDSFRRELAELKPDVVIVDSWATFHTSDENNRQSIQEVLEKVKQLRNEFGCTFVFISHENKGAFNLGEDKHEPSIAQMAGSVALPAAAEFVFTVRKQDNSSIVYNTKNTMSQNIPPFLVDVIDTENGGIQVVAR